MDGQNSNNYASASYQCPYIKQCEQRIFQAKKKQKKNPLPIGASY